MWVVLPAWRRSGSRSIGVLACSDDLGNVGHDLEFCGFPIATVPYLAGGHLHVWLCFPLYNPRPADGRWRYSAKWDFRRRELLCSRCGAVDSSCLPMGIQPPPDLGATSMLWMFGGNAARNDIRRFPRWIPGDGRRLSVPCMALASTVPQFCDHRRAHCATLALRSELALASPHESRLRRSVGARRPLGCVESGSANDSGASADRNWTRQLQASGAALQGPRE